MPRQPRNAPGGLVYHVLNRANARAPLFESDDDYAAFERILDEARRRVPVRLLCYCLMPNHWHLVLRPRGDGDLSAFMRWLTVTHAQRRHAHRHTAGTGHVYQGRFKSFPVQTDEHFLTVCRYVERNPLRAGLVARAEDWHWGSLWRRAKGPEGRPDTGQAGATAGKAAGGETGAAILLNDRPKELLSAWPVDVPAGWVAVVNRPRNAKQEEAVRRSIARSRPFGTDVWTARTANRLGLTWTLRPRGRPRKLDRATVTKPGTARSG